MTPLAPAERSRLARVLELLGSPHDGERLAAGAAAHRIVQARGLRWLDVLAGGETPRPQASAYAWSPPPPAGFAADARACLAQPNLWSAWEAEFLRSIATRRRLSSKQLQILAQLVERLRARSDPGGGA